MPLLIPYQELFARVQQSLPGVTLPDMGIGPMLHVIREDYLQEEFLPSWDEFRKDYGLLLPKVTPFENKATRGICWFINLHFKAQLALAVREAHADDSTGLAQLDANIYLPQDTELNLVAGPSGHRTSILALTRDGVTWRPAFVESQLTYAQHQTTDLDAGLRAGVLVRGLWL